MAMMALIDPLATSLLAAFLAVLFPFFFYLRSRAFPPALGFSYPFQADSLRSRLGRVSAPLLLSVLSCFCLAFLDLHVYVPSIRTEPLSSKQAPVSTEGFAFYLLIDQSGSMGNKLKSEQSGQNSNETKLSLVKEITAQFIRDRSADLIGLITFARVPHILSPLTLDQSALLAQLNKIEPVENQEKNGSAIGYALYKAAHLITATRHFAEELRKEGKSNSYEIKGAQIILVTDGFQDPNYLDYGNRLRTLELDDAADYAKKNGVQLHILLIKSYPPLPEFALQAKLVEKIAQETGGDFFVINDKKDLEKVYAKLESLDKQSIPIQALSQNMPPHEKRLSFFTFLTALGLLAYSGFCLLETVYFKRVP